jgi:hypothetical protein
VTHAANDRALERLERKTGAKDDGWLKAVYELSRERGAALALAKFAQALAGDEPPPREPMYGGPPARVERSHAPRHESPPIIPGSTNDPNSSAYIRPWLQEAVEMPDPNGPDMPKGPWAHWGFERPPSYAREAEDAADSDASDGKP